MRKTNTKVMLIISFVLAFAALWAVIAFAATPGTGYCVSEDLKQTNIKWTMDANGTLTFEIDANAADKIATTELYGKDPERERKTIGIRTFLPLQTLSR